MRLASDSRGRVFRDHLVLERGAGQLNGGGYRIEARTLRISAGEPYASAKVSISGTTRVQVAALTGSLRVTNARGLLVANLLPGAALEFEPQVETDSVFSRLTGTVRKQAGKYFLTDETTNITVELRGAGLDAQVGKRVEINGSVDPAATPAQPATQVVRIQSSVAVSERRGSGRGRGWSRRRYRQCRRRNRGGSQRRHDRHRRRRRCSRHSDGLGHRRVPAGSERFHTEFEPLVFPLLSSRPDGDGCDPVPLFLPSTFC